MSAEIVPQYQYTRLPARCIRALQILSSPSQVNIEITLKVISLDSMDTDHPVDPYECLSYTWGDPRDLKLPLLPMPSVSKGNSEHMKPDTTEKIYNHGQYIKVSENCLHALRRLSGESQRQSWIWIDAICIDQTSDAEKAQQIPLMGEIYKHAANVIIWLGQEDRATRNAQKLLRILSDVDPNSEKLTSRPYNIDSEQAYRQLLEASNDMAIEKIGINDWRHLAHFLRRTWFSRVWVVQEVFFSRHEPRVLIGKHELHWKDIMQTMAVLRKTHLDAVLNAYMFDMGVEDKPYNIARATSEALENRLANAHIFGIMYDRKVENKPIRLDQLLYYTRFFSATKEADHIFGIQGLWISSGADMELTSRVISLFGSPVEMIYIEAMRAAMNETGRLDILGLRGQISKKLPSWVVDFHEMPQLYPLTRNLEFGDHPRRWQAGRGITQKPAKKTDCSDPRMISVDGFEFDEVVGDRAPSFQDVDIRFGSSKLLQILVQARQNAYGAIDAYPAFLRTIIKDTYAGKLTDAEISNAFSAYLAIRILEYEFRLKGIAPTKITDKSHQMASVLEETKTIVNELSLTYSTFPSWTTIEGTKCVLDLEDDTPEKTDLEHQAMKFGESFRIAYFGRRLFQTKMGYFGITSEMVEEGDRVWVSPNSDTPLVLRPQTSNGQYLLVGEAYVHGIMNGEAVNHDRCGHAWIV